MQLAGSEIQRDSGAIRGIPALPGESQETCGKNLRIVNCEQSRSWHANWQGTGIPCMHLCSALALHLKDQKAWILNARRLEWLGSNSRSSIITRIWNALLPLAFWSTLCIYPEFNFSIFRHHWCEICINYGFRQKNKNVQRYYSCLQLSRWLW